MTEAARIKLHQAVLEILAWLNKPEANEDGVPSAWIPGGLLMQFLDGTDRRFGFRSWGPMHASDRRRELFAACRFLGRQGNIVFYPPTRASRWHVALPNSRSAADERYAKCLRDAANEELTFRG